MKKEIIISTASGLIIAGILALLGFLSGLLPKPSDYRIPKGTIAAFALREPPPGWEVYEPAKGRYIIGMDSIEYTLEAKGGGKVDLKTFTPNTYQRVNGNPGNGNVPLIRAADELGLDGWAGSLDIRPPYISLLICIKK